MEFTLGFIAIMWVSTLVFCYHLSKVMLDYADKRNQNADERPMYVDDESVDLEDYSDVEDELSDYEIERLERERDFERRIRSMKDELGINEKRSTRPAEEAHPNVKNLPHNIINSYDDLPDVEHAD